MLQVKDDKKKLKDIINLNTISIFNKLVKNSVWMLFVFNIIIFLFYFMGNFFNYLDTTIFLILKILSFFSILLCIFSIVGFIENIVCIFIAPKKIQKLFSIIFMIFCFFIGLFFFTYSTVLQKLSTGL